MDEGIRANWLVPGFPRSRDVMCKLRLFELLQFEKVLFLDPEMFIVKSMDGIFTDPATDPLTVNRQLAESCRDHINQSFNPT